ncbi:tyrosine decarboxylase-like [Parasteatoda tepidariorum]|uniref:tyrosine decarboxylase-like n=1 Tax=Parasteatoda tepidariorum TaxID=114398 RepID=UPI0039BD698B
MMNSKEFKKAGEEMIDFIANYRATISKRPVVTKEKPGYMRNFVPLKAPMKGEKFELIMEDVEKIIIPGLTHWVHPHFYSYFPLGTSLPSLLGTIITGAFGCSGSTWFTCPASTELEIIIIDWVAKLLGLPEKFLFHKEGRQGGGCLRGSASECTLMTVFAAQWAALHKLKKKQPSTPDGELLSSLVAYCSKEAHSSVEKACLIAMVTLRILDTDDRCRFRGKDLEEEVKEDLKKGLNPFFVVGTFGTTSSTAIDKFDELGPICAKYGLWLHIDGAYGASALVCPEIRHLAKGFEYASSINTNPSKWMLMHFDCSIIWVDDRFHYVQSLCPDSTPMNVHPDTQMIDFYQWSTDNRRRFRALKMWLTIRKFGVEGIQKYVRNHIQLAKKFEELVRGDDRFEVMNDVNFGLVCFRFKNSNEINAKILAAIDASRLLFMVPASLGNIYIIRFSVNYEEITEKEILYAWEVIKNTVEELDLTIDEIYE